MIVMYPLLYDLLIYHHFSVKKWLNLKNLNKSLPITFFKMFLLEYIKYIATRLLAISARELIIIK